MSVRFGLMIRGQFPAGDNLAARFDELCAQARLADTLGFSCITKGSHYGAAPMQDFNQIPFLARIAAEAPHCRLNAGIVLLPMHKPLDIAEQIATLDVLSNGRVIFGCGLGYREVEFKAFGTTGKDRAARLEENLTAVKRLWTGERVTLRGSHFELDDIALSTLPVQRPHPCIWMGANANPGIRRAARMADCWYIPPHNPLDVVMRQLDVYRRALDEAGKPFPAELPMRREVFVAASRAQALRLCGPSLAHKYETYHQWGQSEDLPEGDTLSRPLDELVDDRFLIGSPAQVAEALIAFCRATGVNHVVLSIHWPGMEMNVANDAIELFATEVMPAVRSGL
ncbi:MAG: LLM class flavin-dependent oxidoreductase [Gammaproteobacteria bacterium]|nr:LLM class flavin-dependent oxidoreductase [Gammaproteobacteria bacterium]